MPIRFVPHGHIALTLTAQTGDESTAVVPVQEILSSSDIVNVVADLLGDVTESIEARQSNAP